MPEFLSKDDFYKYVIENRDRQDANKDEVIETLTKAIVSSEKNCKDDIDKLDGRVVKLEDENTKQNRIAGVVAAVNTAMLGLLAFLK
jgi:hypothetical protein